MWTFRMVTLSQWINLRLRRKFFPPRDNNCAGLPDPARGRRVVAFDVFRALNPHLELWRRLAVPPAWTENDV